MALKRSQYASLEAWKAARERKAYVLIGARQTGKTFLLREFAEREYGASWIGVDFLNERDASSLLGGAHDADDFISRLGLLTRRPIPEGRWLLFLDEIQEAPDMLTFMKYLIETGTCDLVLSGSMMGTELKGFRSFPVGYTQVEYLYPLTFEEFCWAHHVPSSVLETVHDSYISKIPLDQSLHEQLIRLFRTYVAVGGMPGLVQTYLDHEYDLVTIREEAEQIVEQYRYDIGKYAQRNAPKIRAVFDQVPSQLAKENKRFHLKNLTKGATFQRYEDEFQWLIDAGVVLPTYQVSEPKYPLLRTMENSKFKLYQSDTGLLMSQYPIQTMLDVIDDKPSVNFGGVYENVVAQELFPANRHLFYYHNSRKGEIDFLVETWQGKVLPVEVKSGKNYKLHTALNNLLETDEYAIDEAVVLTMNNVTRSERQGKPVWYLPLYMASCIAAESSHHPDHLRVPPPRFS